EAADRRIYVLSYLRGRPTRRLLAGIPVGTTGKAIARVIEMNHFFQALKVAVVHIGLDEIGPRPPVDIPQGGHLELALVLRSELCPIRIRVKLPICKKTAYSFIHVRRT